MLYRKLNQFFSLCVCERKENRFLKLIDESYRLDYWWVKMSEDVDDQLLVKSVKYDRKGTSRAANGKRPQPRRLASF